MDRQPEIPPADPASARGGRVLGNLEVDERLLVDGPHGIDGRAAAMAELLTRPELPTAVLAEYDELAIGALWALRRAGLRVPEDISVMGIDNHEMAAFLDLTTVTQDVVAQGRLAAGMLLQLLGAEPGSPSDQPVLVPTRLVLRGSTAPPYAAGSGRSAPDSAGAGPGQSAEGP